MTDSPEHHRQRSDFIRTLVQRPEINFASTDGSRPDPPRTIVQFWHDLRELPEDIEECIASWTRWTKKGFTHRLFDEWSARAFIRSSLDARHERAFDRCYHPAMQSDYFRLCYVFAEGGFYVDADDICIGTKISWLFDDGRLKVQPLCYDTASQAMVTTPDFVRMGAFEPGWIFYVNNNPLIAGSRHPIIERALQRATEILDRVDGDELPEIQETTGPGCLSRSIFELSAMTGFSSNLVVLRDWDSLAVSKWPLSYRSDARNWRLSNQRRFGRAQKQSGK
jgi:hypothetical protein